MAKDEDVCLHCGLCAERCPTGAWDMQKFLPRHGAGLGENGVRAGVTDVSDSPFPSGRQEGHATGNPDSRPAEGPSPNHDVREGPRDGGRGPYGSIQARRH